MRVWGFGSDNSIVYSATTIKKNATVVCLDTADNGKKSWICQQMYLSALIWPIVRVACFTCCKWCLLPSVRECRVHVQLLSLVSLTQRAKHSVVRINWMLNAIQCSNLLLSINRLFSNCVIKTHFSLNVDMKFWQVNYVPLNDLRLDY